MEEFLAELGAYFRRRARLPDENLVRLTSAARAAGSRWDAIAAACGIQTCKGMVGVIYRTTGETPAELLYGTTQYALERLTGGRRFAPLTWACPGCGQQVTDRAPEGRPVHVEHGHAAGCARLARDQALEDQRRREQLPGLIADSERPAGLVQRHRLREPITDDCPRCGWHGYFHEYIATIDGEWATAVCDNCYADLHPDIAVTVRFYSICSPGRDRPFGVIRQRTRSDYEDSDVGQVMYWRLWWEFTPALVEDARGECDNYIDEISRPAADYIAAHLAARYCPPDAARLPWVTSAYPGRLSILPVMDAAAGRFNSARHAQ